MARQVFSAPPVGRPRVPLLAKGQCRPFAGQGSEPTLGVQGPVPALGTPRASASFWQSKVGFSKHGTSAFTSRGTPGPLATQELAPAPVFQGRSCLGWPRRASPSQTSARRPGPGLGVRPVGRSPRLGLRKAGGCALTLPQCWTSQAAARLHAARSHCVSPVPGGSSATPRLVWAGVPPPRAWQCRLLGRPGGCGRRWAGAVPGNGTARAGRKPASPAARPPFRRPNPPCPTHPAKPRSPAHPRTLTPSSPVAGWSPGRRLCRPSNSRARAAAGLASPGRTLQPRCFLAALEPRAHLQPHPAPPHLLRNDRCPGLHGRPHARLQARCGRARCGAA